MFREGSWNYSVEERLGVVSGLSSRIQVFEDADIIARCGTLESGKVDKVSGKGLSENDFTNTYKSKLDGITANATANDTDSNLKNRANHTGTQAISTITGLSTALSDLDGRITPLEAWKMVMPKRQDRYTGTTDANGDVTITFPTNRYTNVPHISMSYIFNNDNYGTFYNIKSLSVNSVTIRVMRNKNSAVLLGANIDPDEALPSTDVVLVATEFA